MPQDRKDRDVWQWSFDIQRELPGDIALTVGYVGSKTTHSANGRESLNAAPPSPDTNFGARRPSTQFYDPATPELGVQALGRIATVRRLSQPALSRASDPFRKTLRQAWPSASPTRTARRTATARTAVTKARVGRRWTAPVRGPHGIRLDSQRRHPLCL